MSRKSDFEKKRARFDKLVLMVFGLWKYYMVQIHGKDKLSDMKWTEMFCNDIRESLFVSAMLGRFSDAPGPVR